MLRNNLPTMTERLVRKPAEEETLDEYLMALRHLAAYNFVLSREPAAWVLDLGCGSGYGTKILAETVPTCGVDLSLKALLAIDRSQSLAHFATADGRMLPFAAGSFDLITSFQVIEHIVDVNQYLAEARRVLTQNGTLIISTPNRRLRLFPFERPHNPYHVTEYAPRSLRAVLKRHFASVEILGLQATPAILQLEHRRLRLNRYTRTLHQIKSLPFGDFIIFLLRRAKWAIVGRPTANAQHNQPGQTSSLTGNDLAKEQFSLSDYWITPDNLPGCLDLFAVCRK